MAFKQQPHEVYLNCIMVMVPGIEDDNDVNLDNVPVWYEPISNHFFGPKGRRRNVLTVGN